MTNLSLTAAYSDVAASAERREDVLVLATEWDPTKGGLSVFNQKLCRSLAKLECRVVCYVPPMEGAARVEENVLIWPAKLVSGVDPSTNGYLIQTPIVDYPGFEAFAPNIVIGHDDKTGGLAKTYRSRWPEAKIVVFVHTYSPGIRPYKVDGAHGARRAAEFDELEALISGADVVACVGPHLHDQVSGIAEYVGTKQLLCFVPGFGPHRSPRTTGSATRMGVLLVARTKDPELKGLPTACAAVLAAAVSKPELEIEFRILGCENGKAEALREDCVANIDSPLVRVTVLEYDPQPGHVAREMFLASVTLMPSAEEGFGLVAFEALGAGCPVLATPHSGFAELLKTLSVELYEQHVVGARETAEESQQEWGRRIRALWANPNKARDQVTLAQEALNVYTWEKSAKALLEYIGKLP